jgi:hypothetical protein
MFSKSKTNLNLKKILLLTSIVCQHFSKIKSETAKCNKCKKVLKCEGSSTYSLSSHLKTYKITINETVATPTLVAETDDELKSLLCN